MRKFTIVAVFAILAWSPLVHAHEGHPHIMGTVVAVNANQIVVQTGEGKHLSISVDKNTTYRLEDKAAAPTDVKVGDRVVAEVSHKGDGVTASEIRFAHAVEHTEHDAHHDHP